MWNDALIIDLQPYSPTRVKITPWADGMKFFRWEQEEWRPDFPDGYLHLELFSTHSEGYSFEDLWGSIPPAIWGKVKQYEFGQLPLLQSLATSSAARELFAHSPHLLWLIANTPSSRLGTENLNVLLSKKRTKILVELGYAGIPAQVKFINKVKILRGDEREFLLLPKALEDPAIVNRLAHSSDIPIWMLHVLQRFPKALKSSFPEQMGSMRFESLSDSSAYFLMVYSLLKDTLTLGQRLDIVNADQIVQRTSCLDIKNLHDRWTARYNQLTDERLKTLPDFPAPPYAGTPDIQPITTPAELKQEGREMAHCVGSYLNRVYDGDCYIYKVTAPERATLELLHTPHGWVVGQCKGMRNAPLEKAIVEKVCNEVEPI